MTETEKRGGGGGKEPFVPDDAWIEAFDAQFAGDFYERMKRFARSKARVLAYYGQVVDEYYAEELVADAINDTLRGKRRWDPKRVDLRKHVLDAIRTRVKDACVHADHFRQVSLVGELGEIRSDVEQAVSDAHALDEDRARMAAALTAALDALREIAGDDAEVVRLVDGYRRGAAERFELVSVTGLTTLQVKAAQKRLHTLLERLPDHLRTDAMRIR